MQPQRHTMTDRLADVIHIIHIGSKSGVLTVERGERETVEEGSITFVNGRIVEASVGMYTGLAAFNYLITWQTCRFSLLSSNEDDVSSSYLEQTSAYHVTTNQMKSIVTQSLNNTGMQLSVPRRQPLGEEVLQQPGNTQISRAHRHLLLLIDGQRNSSDLARLMGRNLGEIHELLSVLERQGFIQA